MKRRHQKNIYSNTIFEDYSDLKKTPLKSLLDKLQMAKQVSTHRESVDRLDQKSAMRYSENTILKAHNMIAKQNQIYYSLLKKDLSIPEDEDDRSKVSKRRRAVKANSQLVQSDKSENQPEQEVIQFDPEQLRLISFQQSLKERMHKRNDSVFSKTKVMQLNSRKPLSSFRRIRNGSNAPISEVVQGNIKGEHLLKSQQKLLTLQGSGYKNGRATTSNTSPYSQFQFLQRPSSLAQSQGQEDKIMLKIDLQNIQQRKVNSIISSPHSRKEQQHTYDAFPDPDIQKSGSYYNIISFQTASTSNPITHEAIKQTEMVFNHQQAFLNPQFSKQSQLNEVLSSRAIPKTQQSTKRYTGEAYSLSSKGKRQLRKKKDNNQDLSGWLTNTPDAHNLPGDSSPFSPANVFNSLHHVSIQKQV